MFSQRHKANQFNSHSHMTYATQLSHSKGFMNTTPRVKSPSMSITADAAIRIDLHSAEVVQLYPQDTTSVASTNRNKTVQKLHLNIELSYTVRPHA